MYIIDVLIFAWIPGVGIMKVTCDEKELQKRTLITTDKLRNFYRKEGSDLDYIEGSRTYDTLRYGKTDSNLPFEFTFTDKHNHDWKIKMEKEDDTVTLVIPCGTQMLWYGADESPTTTGSDAQTSWAEVQFSYQAKTMLPPWHAGVRISFLGLKDKSTGEWKVDSERWDKILDMAKKGTEVTGAIMDQIEKGAKIYSTGGAL